MRIAKNEARHDIVIESFSMPNRPIRQIADKQKGVAAAFCSHRPARLNGIRVDRHDPIDHELHRKRAANGMLSP